MKKHKQHLTNLLTFLYAQIFNRVTFQNRYKLNTQARYKKRLHYKHVYITGAFVMKLNKYLPLLDVFVSF